MSVTVSAEKINRMINTVREKCEVLDIDTYEQLDKNLAVDFSEHFQYQQLQAEAHAMQLLSPEAAMIVYNALGEVGSDENGGWASGTDLPTKVVVTQLMAELLKKKIKNYA